MAATPNFMGNPRMSVATLTAANVNYDGTGTIVPLITAAATGTRILRIEWKGTGDNTIDSGLLNVFYSKDAGTTWMYFGDLSIPLWGPVDATTAPSYGWWDTYIFHEDFILEADTNEMLGCTLTFAPETPIKVIAYGGDL